MNKYQLTKKMTKTILKTNNHRLKTFQNEVLIKFQNQVPVLFQNQSPNNSNIRYLVFTKSVTWNLQNQVFER